MRRKAETKELDITPGAIIPAPAIDVYPEPTNARQAFRRARKVVRGILGMLESKDALPDMKADQKLSIGDRGAKDVKVFMIQNQINSEVLRGVMMALEALDDLEEFMFDQVDDNRSKDLEGALIAAADLMADTNRTLKEAQKLFGDRYILAVDGRFRVQARAAQILDIEKGKYSLLRKKLGMKGQREEIAEGA